MLHKRSVQAGFFLAVIIASVFVGQSTGLSFLQNLYKTPKILNSYFPDQNKISEYEISTNQIVQANQIKEEPKPSSNVCNNLPLSILNEIQSYQPIVNKIISEAVEKSFKGKTYDDLAYFVDKFGPRVSGTPNLETAIDYVLNKMNQDGLDNVHGEKVMVPHWVRGEESAMMLEPRVKKLSILGLGFSVGTPPEGITAEVLVVRSFRELKVKGNEAKGKIIVFNQKFIDYERTVRYRETGASEAATYGAVAALVRSVTDFSINSPHAGMQEYKENVTKIPVASITVEDAQLFDRFQQRGWKIVVNLKMGAQNNPLVPSRNVIAELKGYEKPNEIVAVSGHIDSWDVGEGAMDDGAGAFISYEALALLKHLNLRPKRTLRAILWTSEEPGLWGVQDYVKKHDKDLGNFKAVFESDIGTFKPLGLDFSGTEKAGCIVKEVLKLFEPINATMFRAYPEVGSDIGYLIDKNVPGFSLNTENSKYFWFHHTNADTMTVLNTEELDLNTALWAAASYIFADLSFTLPRTGN